MTERDIVPTSQEQIDAEIIDAERTEREELLGRIRAKLSLLTARQLKELEPLVEAFVENPRHHG